VFWSETYQQTKNDAQAVASAGGGPWSGADDIVVYGYEGMHWQDTVP